MAKKPTKLQLEKQELVRETIFATLAACAGVLGEHFAFSDTQQTKFILETALLLSKYIGTDDAQAKLADIKAELLDGQTKAI